GPGSPDAGDPLVCIVGGDRASDGAAPVAEEGYRHAVGRLRSAYDLVVILGPPLEEGDRALPLAAAGVDCLLACAGPSQARGGSGRRLSRERGALPAERAELVVVH